MKILLVDDEKESRHYLAQFLNDFDHEVMEADDGEQAWGLLKDLDFHMVLSDIQMPVLSGLELLNRMKFEKNRHMPDMVLFTAYSDVPTAVEALRQGAYDYLLKPINIKELLVVMERVAEHQVLLLENKIFNEKFEQVVATRTQEIRQELDEIKEAYFKISGIGNVVIKSAAMKHIYEQLEIINHDRTIPVMIEGETGTGKELIARQIHYGNNPVQVAGPFIAINCSTFSPTLFESEMFGYESGTFTGASPGGKKGKIDMAKGGTLFLDEISEMPWEVQAKLLRLIEEKKFYRVGGIKIVNSDLRIICASNSGIKELVTAGKFRSDLYYRLNTLTIQIPPLRKRREEIVPLAMMFLNEFSRQRGKKFSSINKAAQNILLNYPWSGNVRQLRNTIELATVMWNDEEFGPKHLESLNYNCDYQLDQPENVVQFDWSNFPLPTGGLSLKGLNELVIDRALSMHNGNISKTAKYLDISQRSLSYRLQQKSSEKNKIEEDIPSHS
jgi:DNA-binding NtrC family response regulator